MRPKPILMPQATIRPASAASSGGLPGVEPQCLDQAAPAASDHHRDKPGHYSFAVIGDAPYGDQQIAAFPRWIDQINASDVQLTFHVGDIKNGSTRCDDWSAGRRATATTTCRRSSAGRSAWTSTPGWAG